MKELKQLINNPDTLIIDVRSSWEFESEHIPGAKNIPLENTRKSSRIQKTGDPHRFVLPQW
jgi:rhodanese-related sulfurtransferase